MVTQQGRTTAVELDGKTTVVIGRSSTCDVFLDDSSVSRRHAVLHVHADRVEIEDMGSQNGTLLVGVVRNGGAVATARGDESRLVPHLRTAIAEDKMVLIGTAQLMVHASSDRDTTSWVFAVDDAPEALRARAEDAEKRRVQEALDSCNGNQTRAARLLGLTRPALVRRLEKFD